MCVGGHRGQLSGWSRYGVQYDDLLRLAGEVRRYIPEVNWSGGAGCVGVLYCVVAQGK